MISIHTFLAEGDADLRRLAEIDLLFQSTPSSRKVTKTAIKKSQIQNISIHTFLAEGDYQLV